MQRYVFGNGNNQWDLRLDGILDGFAAMGRSHEDSSSVRFQLFFCFPQVG
jgi:hypothetical protein